MASNNDIAAAQKSYLDALKAERAKIDGLINAIEKGTPIIGGTGGGSGGNFEIQHDTFLGMTIPEAVLKYLDGVGKPARTQSEIRQALKEGGLQAGDASIQVALSRLKNTAHKLTQAPNGTWGLNSWYGKEVKHGRPSKPKKATKVEEQPKAAPKSEKKI